MPQFRIIDDSARNTPTDVPDEITKALLAGQTLELDERLSVNYYYRLRRAGYRLSQKKRGTMLVAWATPDLDRSDLPAPVLPTRLVGPSAAAAYLGVHVSTLHEATRMGQMSCVRVSGSKKFDVNDLDAMIAKAKETGLPVFGSKVVKK